MSVVYRISGDSGQYDDQDFATLAEALMAIREPYLGRTGEWVEDVDANGDFKVTFVEKTPSRGSVKAKTSWKIKTAEMADV